MPPMKQHLLRATEVAKLLAVSVKEVYRLIREGQLDGHKSKDSVLLDARQVEVYRNALREKKSEP
jgi:excisionase family DNA binding protein